MKQNDRAPVIDYTNYITEHTRDFTGREWVFRAINDWLGDPEGTRFFVVSGEPGSGKTSLAGRLFQFAQGDVAPPDDMEYLTPGFLSAIHFCSARDLRWINPYVFSQSLASQLAHRFPAYANFLIEKGGDRRVHIEIEQQIGEGQGIGIVIHQLNLSNTSPEDAFIRAVWEPLEALFQESVDGLVVILVDGLDEALTYSGKLNIISLLAKTVYLLTDKHSSQLRFILTSRRDMRVENMFRDADGIFISAAAFDHYNYEDIEKYVEKRLNLDKELSTKVPREEPKQVKQLIEKLVIKSAGNFQYIRFLLDSIKRERWAFDDLEGLPTGLDGLYYDSLDRIITLGSNDWLRDYAPLMGVLSVAQEGVTSTQLENFTGQSKSAIWKHLGDLQQFIEEVESEAYQAEKGERYQLYHQSVIEFLQARSLMNGKKQVRNRYYLSSQEWHKRIADFYLEKYTGHWNLCDSYGIAHLSTHMVSAGLHEELYTLVAQGRIRNEWVEAHRRINGSYEHYLRDLRLAWNWVESDGWNVCRQIHCALIESSIHSLARGILPELLIQLIKAKLWNSAAVLTFVPDIPNEADRAHVLMALVPFLPDALKPEMLTMTRRIVSWKERIDVLLELAKYLSGERKTQVLREALSAVQAIGKHLSSDLSLKAEKLEELAPHLSKELQDVAFEIAHQIPEEFYRRKALDGLMVSLIHQRTAEILKMIPNLGDEYYRFEMLKKLAKHIPAEFQAEILELVRRLGTEYYRSEVLSELAAYLPENLLGEALALAKEITNPIARAQALSKLATLLSEAWRKEVLSELRGIARAAKTEDEIIDVEKRCYILMRLERFLPQTLRGELLLEVIEAAKRVVEVKSRIANEWKRADELGRLVKLIPEEAKAEVMPKVLNAIRGIDNEDARARALQNLKDSLPTRGIQVEALNIVCDITDGHKRFNALITLVEYLPEDLLAEVVTMARRIKFGLDRARVLAKFELAPVWRRRGSWNILPHRKGGARCQRNNEPLRKSSNWKRCV